MAGSGDITLDHINDFFSLNKKPQPIHIGPTATGGQGLEVSGSSSVLNLSNLRLSESKGTDYVKKYQEQEDKLLRLNWHRSQTVDVPLSGNTVTLSQLSQIEELSTISGDFAAINDLHNEEASHLYATYMHASHHNYNKELVITPYRDKIVELIDVHQVVIIQGSTGCGKTTQVPQYILDHCAEKGRHCSIVVTQPRKIAATSIARRVCQERNWELGSICGYQVSMDSQTSDDTRLSYVTTGVLLQKLIHNRNMNMYTHVIIDEVHERDQDTDFALLVVRKFLRTTSKAVKVILMSATFDTDMFARYFSILVFGKLESAPVFTVPGKSKAVTEFYLDELRTLGTVPKLDPSNPLIPEESYHIAFQLIRTFDRIEAQEQETVQDGGLPLKRGAVLIFLPGYFEISEMEEKLKEEMHARKWWILPLHSSITVDEQTQVFRHPLKGYRKIILSTNIAESSITVPDIKYVIDFCLTKTLYCDRDTNYSCLMLDWASKANCQQRSGRAGRVSEGRVYKMVPYSFYEKVLNDYGQPEMKRCPLEQVVLMAKKLGMEEPKAVLALALEPPNLEDIERAILVLKEVNALSTVSEGHVTPYDGDLTFIGSVMALLPLDVRLSRLILLGHVFGCLKQCIIIAASLHLKSFFSKPFGKLLEAYKSRLAWADGSFSDCLAFLKAYCVWEEKCQCGDFRRPGGQSESQWAFANFIQLRRIKEVAVTVKELICRLDRVNIRIPRRAHHIDEDEQMFLLKIVIAGAFYPNYFVRELNDEKEIIKTLSDKDPLCTVVIRLPGLSPMEGSLYTFSIREMFRPCSNKQIRIDFEEGKALVQFTRGQQIENSVYEPMGILMAVYLAVKMRQLRIPLVLKLFSQQEARQRMEQLQLLRNQQCEKGKILRSNRITLVSAQQALKQIPLPSTETVTIRLFVPTVLDCGHFWALYADDINRSNLAYIEETINIYGGKNLQVLKSPPEPGMLVLAPYVDGRGICFYRARIEDVMSDRVYVFFVDYGNTACIKNLNDIYDIDPEKTPDLLTTPAQAFECVLSEVRPSALRSPRGQWTKEARDWFKTQIDGQDLVARVYSVVQNVVRLELVKVLPNGQEMSINKKLIDYQFAEASEESYLSKQNHELRTNLQMFSTYNILPPSSDVEEGGFVHLPFKQEFQEKPSMWTTKVLRLQGPYSPLEISYRGISCLGISRTVRIDRESVNSVALDPEPQDQHERMLVASHVGLSSSGSAIIVRNTTLMPNIHGLSSIIALLFAPYAELRTDIERSCYTGALCGLGYDPRTNQSIYPDHDMELVFDTTFDCEDISAINKVRMGINLLLGSEEKLAQWAPDQIMNIQKRVNKHLQELISRNRKSRELQEFRRSHRWQQVPQEYQLCSCLEGTEADSYHVLPLHKAVSLCGDTFLEKMREHLIDLQTKASRSLQREVNRCNLCDITLHCPRDLLLHLESELHLEREKELFN